MKKYSVLLLYPDYLAHNFGHETFLAHVEAADAAEAVSRSQKEASLDPEDDPADDPADFYPLLVIEGHHEDLNP